MDRFLTARNVKQYINEAVKLSETNEAFDHLIFPHVIQHTYNLTDEEMKELENNLVNSEVRVLAYYKEDVERYLNDRTK